MTGTITPGPNGTAEVDAPIADFPGIAAGTTLLRPSAATYVREGVSQGPLEPADSRRPDVRRIAGSVLKMREADSRAWAASPSSPPRRPSSPPRRGRLRRPTLKPFCTTGPIRCLSALRTDLPIVPGATAAHSGYGAQDLQAAYNLAQYCRDAGQDARRSRSWTRTTTRRSSRISTSTARTTASARARRRTAASRRSTRTASRATTQPSPTPTGSRRSRSTSRWSRRSARSATSSSSRRTRPTRRSRPSNPAQTADLGASVDTAVKLGATEVSNSYGTAGPEPNQTSYDHYYNHPGVAITAGTGDFDYGTAWPGTSPYVTAVGGTELDEGSVHEARLERVRLGQRLPRHRAERGAGHRQRLLDLGAEAGLAARRRLRPPHGRGRLRGRGRRRDLRQLAGDRRLGRRRRHEHRHAGHRRGVRARRQREDRAVRLVSVQPLSAL